jgi:hypothetical protein
VKIEEGSFVKVRWIMKRALNGDEAAYGISIGRNPSALYVEAYKYNA